MRERKRGRKRERENERERESGSSAMISCGVFWKNNARNFTGNK